MALSAVPEQSPSTGNLPPATPAYIFRGHTSTLHAIHFFSGNRYLASADADGWIIIWSLASRRPVVVWKAHEGGILGIKNWGDEILLTHGRDHSLRAWQLKEDDYESLDKTLPAQRAPEHQGKDPWLLHSMPVNALNFCAFSSHDIAAADAENLHSSPFNVPKRDLLSGTKKSILIACPNALDNGGIDLFHLPSERRIAQIKSDPAVKTGMVMAVKMFIHKASAQLAIISGYEDGHTIVHRRLPPKTGEVWQWQRSYVNRSHSQPILAIDVSQDGESSFTSSADALLVKHPIVVDGNALTTPLKSLNTRHAGQQGLNVRDDGKIFATAGWDGRIRVYSRKTMQELAVLKWHKDGCYCVAFAQTLPEPTASAASDDAQDQPLTISALAQIKQKRAEKAQQTHWLAAGGKDGKISLWDVY